MVRHLLKYLVLFLVFVGISSCKIQREYNPPVLEEVPNYNNAAYGTGESFSNTSWWNLFNDSILTSLIKEGMANNLPLNSMVNQLRQSQLQMEIVGTQLYPGVNYGITGKGSLNTSTSGFSESLVAATNVSYTLDLWGKIRNQNEAALQAYLATEMAYHQVRATLVSQIATIYFTLRDVDNKIIVAEGMIANMSDFKEIIEARYEGGFISKVDLNQISVSLKDAQVVLQGLLRARNQLENAMSVALGSAPKTIARGLPLQEQIFPSSLPTGVPMDLLQRRPSILIAEHRLKAQLATIGATEALQYPNLTLSLDLGSQLSDPSMLFSEFAGSLAGPIFNWGRIKKSIQIEEEKYAQWINDYKQAYLLAFQEVEDALIAMDTYEEEYNIRKAQLELSQEALDLAWIRYNEGVTSLLEFLNLQTSLFNAQLLASENYKSYLQSIVRLYLALGGGWDSETNTN
ncbi:MAG: efflux transporter outer membrane subunit [Flavobacteriaceae bacterium]